MFFFFNISLTVVIESQSEADFTAALHFSLKNFGILLPSPSSFLLFFFSSSLPSDVPGFLFARPVTTLIEALRPPLYPSCFMCEALSMAMVSFKLVSI